jgi:MFS family permease
MARTFPLRSARAIPYARRSFILNVINGALSFAGWRAADLSTVVPLLVLKLVGYPWAVGLTQAVQDTARVGTQLFASRLLDARAEKRPAYVLWSVVRVAALCAATLALVRGVGQPAWAVLAVLLASLFVLMVGNGIAELAWSDITARSVPSRRRGTLLTARRVLGLLLSVTVAAPLVDWLLSPRSPYPFPANYGMLFLINTVLSGAAWFCFSLIPEPRPDAARRRLTLTQHLTRGVRLVRRDENYRGLLRLRLLLGLAGAVPPFLMAYGKVALGMPDEAAALFLTLRTLTEMVGSAAMGAVSDRVGNRLVLVVSTWAGLATFVLATLSAWMAHDPPGSDHTASFSLLAATFLVLGFFNAARDMGDFNYMLEIAPGPKRPSYLSFANAFLFPLSLLPIGVGAVAPRIGYLPLFAAAAVISAAAVLAAWRLEEPRRSRRVSSGGPA